MAYKYLFMNNNIYTAQDVNDAISSLISGGVSNYPLGLNAVADLNSSLAEMTAQGVQYKGTSCLVTNTNGVYKISEGTCFMNDGSQIVFDGDGYEIAHTSGVKEYVYLERDVVRNKINVVVSETSGGEDTVALAEINADGSVTDRRRFAKAKIALTAEPQNLGITKRIQHERMSPGTSFDVDLGFNGWKYIIYAAYDYKVCLELTDGSYTNRFPTSNTDGWADGKNRVTRNGSVLHFENRDSTQVSSGYSVEIEVR